MGMASVDAEAEMENLFNDDDVHQDGGVESTQSLTQEEEQQRAEGGANLDVTGAGEVKKRIIRNPQPKLNPERIMGPRGVQTIEDLFTDWESKGKGKEFDDLDTVMKKMELWAHRLYPKLPFNSVLDIVANRLGKKKVVQTHVKKIRLGMVTQPVNAEVEGEQKEDEREVERYGEEEQPDVFGELLRQAGGDNIPMPPVQSNRQVTGLTDEQRERIRKNKELAALKRKEKQEREQKEAEEEARRKEIGNLNDDEDEIEREMMSAPAATTEWSQNQSSQSKIDSMSDTSVLREEPSQMKEVTDLDFNKSISSASPIQDSVESEEVMGLDEMLDQMDES